MNPEANLLCGVGISHNLAGVRAFMKLQVADLSSRLIVSIFMCFFLFFPILDRNQTGTI